MLLWVCGWVAVLLGVGARPSDPENPPWYDVDLDAPPETRWAQVLHDYRSVVPELIATVRQLVPIEYIPAAEKLAVSLDTIIPAPFNDEMRGIADGFDMDLGEIVLLNIIYDVTAYCTSIVAQDSQGTVWHARNLDYYYGDILRNVTINVNYKKGNQTLYTGTTYAGYVGLVTGQKPHAFTVTVDQRGHHVHVGWWWQNLLEAIFNKQSSFVSFLVRQVLESSPDFHHAVDTLALQPLHAPVYYIVAGNTKGQGVIITRDRISAVDRLYLNPLQGIWYLVETNYDNWTTPPPYDAQRRAVAKASMEKLGQGGVNKTSLFNVISTKPVMNENTTYSIVFSAANPDVYQTWIRWP